MQTASRSQASIVDNGKQTVLVVWGWGNFYGRPGLVENPEDRQVPASHEDGEE